ncbi:lysylphosphatidylglycerol synthase domain-containing protein [Phycicoccus sp.]|uniref:lysylphosphatidylglycerol synthase domain-containing protein n=1 Tax=Phycicoccus sp. TaxID=1902410 RepID=UPI002C21C95E|nr:lysylphosphatidylglycerol synthase domain-containing protein [Phycicoccus sp.]HMM95046.1 lysylphosphatidylglycerol synthase domain-containing protein [Phycicoccus sp.]
MTKVWGPGVRMAAGAALAATVVALALPKVTGTSWRPIVDALSRPTPTQLAVLAVLWLLGLWAHTPSLTAALPGLSHRRALLLNLTGSFVSNLLPLGGAAGTVVNWRMARTWGFGSAAFGRWALVTNLADLVVKLLLPGAVLCWFAAAGSSATHNLTGPGVVGVALLAVLVAAVVLVGRDDRAVRWAGGRLDRLAARLRPLPSAPEGWGERAARFRRESADLVRAGWGRLLGAKVLYALLQAVLLWACLSVVGAPAAPVVVASAFVVERLLSMLVLTPGATGIVEVGMAGALTALGVPAAPAAAGVLLYRAFVIGMEVPVGGLGLLGWWLSRRRAGHLGAAARVHPTVRPVGRWAHAGRLPTEGAARWSTRVSAAPASPSAGSRSGA